MYWIGSIIFHIFKYIFAFCTLLMFNVNNIDQQLVNRKMTRLRITRITISDDLEHMYH